MTAQRSRELDRARREVRAARVLAEGDFTSQAVSRAYYAAFYGAEAAPLAVGETRSKHGGVILAFGKYVVQGGGLDGAHGRALAALFDKRNAADYRLEEPTSDEARAAIEDAERFVAAVAIWLSERS
jgi:uncharacterized protein (UPF0332 family)